MVCPFQSQCKNEFSSPKLHQILKIADWETLLSLYVFLAKAACCSPVFSVSSVELLDPQAEPTPVVDRLVLEYKGSDLQSRWAASPATAAERQEKEAVHHTAIDGGLPLQNRCSDFNSATGSSTVWHYSLTFEMMSHKFLGSANLFSFKLSAAHLEAEFLDMKEVIQLLISLSHTDELKCISSC